MSRKSEDEEHSQSYLDLVKKYGQKKERHLRRWLNPKRGTASIEVEFRREIQERHLRGGDKEGVYSVDLDINISDCVRKVSLEFNYGEWSDRKTKAESMAKLNKLIDALLQAKVWLEECP